MPKKASAQNADLDDIPMKQLDAIIAEQQSAVMDSDSAIPALTLFSFSLFSASTAVYMFTTALFDMPVADNLVLLAVGLVAACVMLYTAISKRAAQKLASINASRKTNAQNYVSEQPGRVQEAVMYSVAEQNLVFLTGFYFFTFQIFRNFFPESNTIVFLGGLFSTPVLQLLYANGTI